MNVNFPRPDAIYDLTPYLDELGLESISALTLQCAYRVYAARQKLKRLRRAKAEKDDVDAAEKDDVDAAAEKDAATMEGYVLQQVQSDADGDCSFHPDTHLLTVGEDGCGQPRSLPTWPLEARAGLSSKMTSQSSIVARSSTG